MKRKILLFASFVIVAFALGSCSGDDGPGAPTFPTQAKILEEIYNSLGGDNWTDKTGWLTDAPLEEWYGVSVDDNGKVISLDLYNNNLSGTIPSSIGGLSNLMYLVLDENPNLTGQVPSTIGYLKKLEGLYLRDTSLEGNPLNHITGLTKLEYLHLGGSSFSGTIPSGIGNLTNLQDFCIEDNNFSGTLPAAMGKMVGVGYIKLYGNRFTGLIPASVVAWLEGSDTNRSSYWPQQDTFGFTNPDPTESAVDRAALIAIYNAMGGESWTDKTNWNTDAPLSTWDRVERVGELSGRVVRLDLDSNNLVGDIPAEIGNLSALIELRMYYNPGITGNFPATFWNLTGLTHLDMDGCEGMTGTISPNIKKLNKLRTLWICDNEMSGQIMNYLVQMPLLEYIYISESNFTGSIPSTINNLKNLYTLEMNDSDFSGTIPSTIGELTKLYSLYLNGNAFSGTVPESLGNLPNLNYLALSGNRFASAMPQSVIDLIAAKSIPYGNIWPQQTGYGFTNDPGNPGEPDASDKAPVPLTYPQKPARAKK